MRRFLLLLLGSMILIVLAICVGLLWSRQIANKKIGESDMDWILKEYNIFLDDLEDKGVGSCDLNIYVDNPYAIYFTNRTLDSLINHPERAEIHIVSSSYLQMYSDTLSRLTAHDLETYKCTLCQVEVRPILYYTINRGEETVLEVLFGGYCEHYSDLVRINGFWFEGNRAVYEVIWPFLPAPVQDEYDSILENL